MVGTSASAFKPAHMAVPVRKIETIRPVVAAVVDEIVAALSLGEGTSALS